MNNFRLNLNMTWLIFGKYYQYHNISELVHLIIGTQQNRNILIIINLFSADQMWPRYNVNDEITP